MHTSVMKKAGLRTQHADCCKEARCDSGLRNNYFDGKRLSTHSFQVEQQYGFQRRRLLNRAIHGWGVVYGYAITPEPLDKCKKQHEAGKLGIGLGLALDQCGRELLQTASRNVGLDDLIPVEDGKQVDLAKLFPPAKTYGHAAVRDTSRDCWLLSAHYAEQYNGPVDVKGICQCEHREWDQICETVRYSLQSVNCDKCCCNFECELNCECGEEPCEESGEKASHPEDQPRYRGGCRCLCQYLTNLKLEDDCGPLCTIEEPCGNVRVDLRHGVPLACVKVSWDEICDQWTLSNDVEACGPRRLVKRNDLLFDLIRGCDLTRISKISWEQWHRSEDAVRFTDFDRKFGSASQNEEKYVTDFWVEFSRPVRKETLRSDCFAISVISAEREGGWREALRVPIVEINTEAFSVPNHPDYVRGGSIVVEGSWLEDAVRGRKNRFLGAPAWVEIEIRGDYILDCNGQTVDANSVGLVPYGGSGAPGGKFLSCFRVEPATETHYSKRS